MNTYLAVDVSYLRSNRTIETILLRNKAGTEKVYFVYNYEGWFFRVFENPIELMDFFDDKFETKVYFESEEELGNYLKQVEIINY